MKKDLVILVGPSGVGKSTLLERAIQDFEILCDTVTVTTRPMRTGEKEGVPYHFVDRKKFEDMMAKGYFIEWAEVHGNLYGTPSTQLEEYWAKGRVAIMDVDIQGAKTFKARYPQALTIFIVPPSIDALRQRVIAREGGKPPADLEVRMQTAQREIKEAHFCDHQVVNADFETAYSHVQKLIVNHLKNR